MNEFFFSREKKKEERGRERKKSTSISRHRSDRRDHRSRSGGVQAFQGESDNFVVEWFSSGELGVEWKKKSKRGNHGKQNRLVGTRIVPETQIDHDDFGIIISSNFLVIILIQAYRLQGVRLNYT